MDVPDLPGEEWADVYGKDGYYVVSNLGRVKSLPREVRSKGGTRMVRGRLLKPRWKRDGYAYIMFSIEGQKSENSLHATMFESFRGGPVDAGMVVAHVDKVKTHNVLTNLGAYSITDSHLLNFRLGVSTDWGIGAHTKAKARVLDELLNLTPHAQTCRVCKRELPLASFTMKRLGYPERTCKECRAKHAGIREVGKVKTALENFRAGLRKCSACKEVLPLDQYGLLSRGYGGRRNVCKHCMRARDKVRVRIRTRDRSG